METERLLYDLDGHEGEIISLNFSSDGDRIVTGSFDKTAKVWDVRSGELILTLAEHTADLSKAIFEFSGDFLATSSLDNTVKIWDF